MTQRARRAAGRGRISGIGLGAGLLAGSWLALKRPEVQRADVRVGDAVRRLGSPEVDRAVAWTTDLGSIYAVVGAAAALAAAGRRERAADVLGVGILAWNLSQQSKTRVRRQRPYEADGVRRLIRPPAGSSFPSGHAAVGAAVMTVLADQSRGPTGRALFRSMAAYVAFTRVYVGVHYPTDVVGGAGLGVLLGSLWRGSAAAAGRAGVRRGLGAGRRALLPALRVAAAVALGARIGRGSPRRSADSEEVSQEAA
ncbi:MAG TPA: phosphatase PAP2 family protein [Egibacteraceae bacterium]|nr:phosphatase PAP2 family protein [Egibacteraceae bacterium]